MSGNSTSLYTAVSSSNGTTTSNNFTTLYPNAQGVIVPTTPYGNANVVSLLAAGSDGGNTISNIIAAGNIYAQNFIGNLVANLIVPGNTGQIIFNNAGQANASPDLTFATGNSLLTVAGNISGNYFIGNGSQLTGIASGYGNANVANFLPTYGGNVNAATVFGQGIATQGYDFVQMQYSNAVSLPVSPYDIGTGSFFYLDAGGATFQSNTTGTLKEIILGNDSSISATGNITGNYIKGNGSQLTGLPATYGNANVVSLLANFGSNTIGTTGNIAGGYILGNGSQLTGLPATYGNANVVGLLANFGSNSISTTGNVSAGYLIGNIQFATGSVANATYALNAGSAAVANSVSGANVSGTVANATYATSAGSATTASTAGLAQYVTGNAQGNITSVGTLNSLSVSGNVVGNYYFGNGSQLTGIVSSYGNANVATFLASGTNTQDIITQGTVQGNLIQTPGSSGNIIGANYVSANYYLGNGAFLTGLAGTYSNSNVASFLANFGSNSIVTTGNIFGGYFSASGNVDVGGNLNSNDITSSNVTVYGDQIITGNLTVQGTTTTINSNTISTNDKNITVANNQSTSANIDGAGIDAGNPSIATWRYSAATQSWQSNIGITPIANSTYDLGTASLRWNNIYANVANVTGNVSANYYTGNGSLLTGVVATDVGTLTSLSVTGTATLGNVSTAGFVSAAGNVTGAYHIGNGSLLTSLTGANVTGTVANAAYATSAGSATTATTAGTVTSNAQANITSVGVLTSLSVSGTTQSGNLYTAGAVSATGNVTGAYIFGNGSQLTGLPATYGNANVVTLLANFGSNVISTTGIITGGNITGANILTIGVVSATGNVSGNYFIGNGSQLTGIAVGGGGDQFNPFLLSGM